MVNTTDLYQKAQIGLVDIKGAVFELLQRSEGGMTTAEIGRSLGIYMDHAGHEGHISGTILAMMETEGAAWQEAPRGKWHAAGRDGDGGNSENTGVISIGFRR